MYHTLVGAAHYYARLSQYRIKHAVSPRNSLILNQISPILYGLGLSDNLRGRIENQRLTAYRRCRCFTVKLRLTMKP